MSDRTQGSVRTDSPAGDGAAVDVVTRRARRGVPRQRDLPGRLSVEQRGQPIADLVELVAVRGAFEVEHLLAAQFRKNGYDPRLAGLYGQALVGMVAQVGAWPKPSSRIAPVELTKSFAGRTPPWTTPQRCAASSAASA